MTKPLSADLFHRQSAGTRPRLTQPSPGVYFRDIPPVFHLYPPVSHHILGVPLYPFIDLYLAVLQQIHCIPPYPTVSSCIRTYLAVSRPI